MIGNVSSDKICQDIALSLTPIVDSPNLKFQLSSGVIVFHFATEVSKSEVYAFVMGVLYGISNSFILTEVTDNMSAYFPPDILKHLLDLDDSGDSDVQIKLTLTQIKKNLDTLENDDDDDDYVALLLEQEMENLKKPSLDQLLDKISSHGIESLNMFEKKILESYSKI